MRLLIVSGFYKAVTITSPPVIKAIRELLAHNQPYIGAFLLKDSESDSDVITSLDQVHPVGVFAQITSVFGSADNASPDGKDKDKPETLTAVLYPHRRIHIDELVTRAPAPEAPQQRVEATEVTDQEAEGEVTSFERDVPSADSVREQVGTLPSAEETEGEGDVASFEQREFLRNDF